MIKNYFKTALRALVRSKAYSAINILGLSLGLACTMLILLYVKDEVSYDRFHVQAKEIFRVDLTFLNKEGASAGRSGFTGFFQGPRFTANIPEIKSFVRISDGRRDFKSGTVVSSVEMLEVDSNFLSEFSFPVIYGNAKTALREPNSVVISEDFARKQFGSTNVVGKLLTFKNDDKQFVPYSITAVTRRCPQNSSIKFEILLPVTVAQSEMADKSNWMNQFLNTFVVLKPGADIKRVEQKMKGVYEKEAAEVIKTAREKYSNTNQTFFHLQNITSLHLDTDYGLGNGLTEDSNPMYSYILSGIAFFILLIACINFINLTVARSVKRAKEIGIRKVVGGRRPQLIAQFLGESFVLCLAAFLLALLFVEGMLPIFNRLSNKALSLSYLLDAKLIAAYAGLFLVTTFLAGFYPALVLSGYQPVETLYSRFRLSGKNYLQRGLVVLQFSLASILIIVTIIIYQQFNYLTTEKLGYDDSNLVSVHVNGRRMPADRLAPLRDAFRKNPNFTDISFKNGGNWFTAAHINQGTEISFAIETIDDHFLPLLKIPVISGRNFSPLMPTDSSRSVLVNEAFVKKAGWKNPIGQVVDFWYNEGEKYQVIGVTKDYHFQSLSHEISPQVFTMKPENGYANTFIGVRPGRETAASKFIDETYKNFFPQNSFSFAFQDETNRKNYESEANWKSIMLFGAVLTIFISCIGLFGLSVLSAEKRTKEIGIRKVLGASVRGVMVSLSADFVKLVLISLVIAIPVAWYAASRWLESYPYRIHVSGWTFALAAVLVSFIALFTVSFQALRAATANPVNSLRSE